LTHQNVIGALHVYVHVHATLNTFNLASTILDYKSAKAMAAGDHLGFSLYTRFGIGFPKGREVLVLLIPFSCCQQILDFVSNRYFRFRKHTKITTIRI